ncbi:Putative exonuclease of the beta-lactamase foldinvolved in RNA processing [Halorhabdus sp. SVX81]|uniref:MBL fold metallo-hydrolase n=1 Tax=Halorhabdus sp. SVX81 TaxID=2978283 RepID=UPI0023DB8C51|nr:MBL fold metallo-hydrolase [Halorhabdus sp. SVX81]WEL16432.1 Putative exonuclease of the beta-lactamase foldinvolved in RNA processing [Halorhabdus sp. SVX81]
MQVSYQHANPHDGRESHLVRFHDEIHDQTTCILVDSGSGVDVEDLLGEDEYLSAILLTHAHLDHYRTLGSNLRDGAPIYATPGTAAAITTRLDTDAEHADLDNPDDVRAAIEPITDWTTITSDVHVNPVPAGHAPGACGFVVRFADGDDHHHLFATGDFTTRRAAGYPGLATDLSVDAVFLTAATNADFRDQLTGAVATAVERATAGSTVLTTTSGSTGVHLAYLLAHLARATDLTPPVTVAGRVATLWEAFEYDHPAVECVPTFKNPDEVLGPGRITIAGPEVPIAGSSERLFDAIEDDAGATLVQVTSGAFDPEHSAGCTVHDYQLSNHPTEETVDSVVEALGPIHVVISHQRGYVADQYKDKYDSFVWATDDATQYTLYDDGWSGPPWVTEATHRRVRSRRYTDAGSDIGGSFDTADIPLPTVGRHDDVDLVAEGIDTARLAEDLGLDPSVLEASAVAAADENADETVAVADGRSVSDTVEGASQSDGRGERRTEDSTAGDDLEVGSDSIADVLSRLDRIENAVTGTRTGATVVDAGDGVTLLRLTDESLAEDLTHGQLVELVIQTAPDSRDETGTD